MGLADDIECRMCGEDDETMEHLLCECHALARQRMNSFGNGYPEPKEFRVLPLNSIIRFVEMLESSLENVMENKLGIFLQLRFMISYSGDKYEEISTKDFVVNDLAIFRFRFEDKMEEPMVCSILTLRHEQTDHSKVKVRVSCQEVDEAFYSEWICNNEWKVMGKKCLCDVLLDGVYTSMLNINITASKVENSFLMNLYNDVDFTDFNLSADEGSVAVHRAHLAAHSDVFRAMLTREWKETTEGRIKIKGVTLQTLLHFKEYMYLRTLPDDGLESLLLLASYYLIDDLKAECVSMLTLRCKTENWSSLLELAVDNKIPELVTGLALMSPALSIKEEKDNEDDDDDEKVEEA